MFRKMMIGLLVVGGMLFIGSGVASAQYAEPSTLTRTGGSGCSAGGAVQFSATGALPGSDVTFIFQSDPVVLGIATADDAGVAVLDASWPADATAGAHTVVAQGTDGDGNPFQTELAADCAPAGAAPAAAPAGALPRTGSDSLPWARTGAILVAVGGLTIAATRRRNSVVRENA